MLNVPFNDLKPGYLAYKAEIDAAVARALASGWYILGEETAAFESEFAAFCGAAGCVGVNSGTDALALALRALGIGAGDEVITVAHTAVATVAAIVMAGATPVLADIDPLTFTLSPATFEAAITPRTRAVIPVHLYGQPADMDAILQIARAHNLRVVEDCAQAHGALYKGKPVGALGDVGTFSFYPTKNLGAMGDGGAIVSRDPALLERARLLREYGWTPAARYVSQIEGVNSRLDELQAAILRVRLRHLPAENAARARIAARYTELLSPASPHLVAPTPTHLRADAPDHQSTPSPDHQTTHVWHLYVVRVPQRDRVRALLAQRGVGTGIHYPVPVHLQPAYAHDVVRISGSLAESERAAASILSLPMHPYLSDDAVEYVAETLLDVIAAL